MITDPTNDDAIRADLRRIIAENDTTDRNDPWSMNDPSDAVEEILAAYYVVPKGAQKGGGDGSGS